MITKTVAISSLRLDPANARKHDEKNLAAIKGSLSAFGQQKPIVVSEDGTVIAGNGTLEAARALGWDDIAVAVSGLEGTDRTAFALADNRTAELAEWDDAVLTDTLRGLDEVGFDVGAIGFDGFDLSLPPGEGLTDPDEIPENVETRCKPGDLWVLGEHRLLCGDSTDVLQVERLMGGGKADMVFTDPPYGISIVKAGGTVGASARRGFAGAKNAPGQLARAREYRASEYRAIEGDDAPFDPSQILAMDFKTVVLWGANHYASKLPDRPQWLVWDKKLESGSLDHNNFSDVELAWTNRQALSARIYRHTWAGMLRSGERSEELKDRVHPTQKPVGLCAEVIADFSKENESVLDLFLGSGSTLIACEKTGRRCFGMEIDPKYCDVILSRWEQFMGKTASLASDQGA